MRASWVLLVAMMVACVQKNDQKKEEDYPVLETMGYYQLLFSQIMVGGEKPKLGIGRFLHP